MQRDKEYLLDIFEAAKAAVSYIQGKSEDEFFHDVQCQDAVIRRLELIGEAARRLSDSTRESLCDLPWKEMIGMRNRLIHQYDDVDLSIVWNTVQQDMPVFIERLKGKI
jgi:uncharacterized protein with HEPN domain